MKNMVVGSERCPTQSRADGLLARDLGDEYLFFDRENDRVHVLNGTAREIYMLCDGKHSIDGIAAQLAEHHGIDTSTALRDTEDAIRQLIEIGLLELP